MFVVTLWGINELYDTFYLLNYKIENIAKFIVYIVANSLYFFIIV